MTLISIQGLIRVSSYILTVCCGCLCIRSWRRQHPASSFSLSSISIPVSCAGSKSAFPVSDRLPAKSPLWARICRSDGAGSYRRTWTDWSIRSMLCGEIRFYLKHTGSAIGVRLRCIVDTSDQTSLHTCVPCRIKTPPTASGRTANSPIHGSEVSHIA